MKRIYTGGSTGHKKNTSAGIRRLNMDEIEDEDISRGSGMNSGNRDFTSSYTPSFKHFGKSPTNNA